MQSSLRLFLSWETTSHPITIQAHALTRAFTSGVTWNKYDGTHAWTTPGGDFASAVPGYRVVGASEEGEELHFGFTPQVEEWVRNPSTNHGILLKAAEESVAGYDAFAQAENPEEAPEPTLEVIYEPRLGIPPQGEVIQESLGNGGVMSVNLSNGNLNVANPDVEYHGEGYETELGRSYNSLDDLIVGGSFGNWRLNKGNDTELYRDSWDGGIFFYGPDGGEHRFDREPAFDGYPSAGDKAFKAESEVPYTLIEHADGGDTLTNTESGVEWIFGSAWSGPLEILGEGNALSLSYSSGRLTSASDSHEHSISVTRDGATHDITELTGKEGESWKYEYSGGRLSKYSGPGGAEAKYGYYEGGLLHDIEDSSGTWVISYDEQKRVTSLRKLVNGTISTPGSEDETTTFTYASPESPPCNPASDALETTVGNPGGPSEAEVFCFNNAGRLTEYVGREADGGSTAEEGEGSEAVLVYDSSHGDVKRAVRPDVTKWESPKITGFHRYGNTSGHPGSYAWSDEHGDEFTGSVRSWSPPTLAWSFEFGLETQEIARSSVEERATMYTLPRGRKYNYSDYHPREPVDYMWHGSVKLAEGQEYQLALNFNFVCEPNPDEIVPCEIQFRHDFRVERDRVY